jgi:SAM-dependent methyltransferase
LSRSTSTKPYRWLAEYYDQFFGSFTAFSDSARAVVLGPILPRVKSACDIACGTGTTALQLAQQGIKMFGVDLSAEMCRQARAKARRAGLALDVIQADMRRFRLPERVDLVLCEFDALNHVENKSDLKLVAASVARALNPGGYFYFDVNNRLAFEKVWPSTWWQDKGDVALVMHGGYDRERDKGWTNVEWFFRRGRYWVRRQERVEQVSWTPAEIRATLRAAGFDRIRAWDATPFFGSDPYILPGCRTVYLARRK